MRFGVELEFSLLDAEGSPALGTASHLSDVASAAGLSSVPELGSFQIELNPGPWPLTKAGVEAGLAELRNQVHRLRGLASADGLVLCSSGLLPRISPGLVEDERLFTPSKRFRASRQYFRNSSARLLLSDGSSILFPGESAVACINEVHVHVQLQDDARTIALLNFLNSRGYDLARSFLHPLQVNGLALAPGQSTMTLFEQANGEADSSGTMNRVGFLPEPIESFEDYERVVHRFPAIPCDRGYLPAESTVYFWVRLRGKPGALRVEYRPPEMSEHWEASVLRFLRLVCPREVAL